MLNTEKQEHVNRNNENQNDLHSNTTKQILTKEDKINEELVKSIMIKICAPQGTRTEIQNLDWKST